MKKQLLSALVLMTLATVGCTKTRGTSAPGEKGADLFSDRPVGSVNDIFVVTLKEPPLLVAGQKTAAGWQIPASAKDALIKEQDEFTTHLAQVAPDAKIIYRYRMTLNGFALFAPAGSITAIQGFANVRKISASREMARPEAEASSKPLRRIGSVTSVNFIGAEAAYAQGIRGQGMKVGIIDTGIDYTHAMLGGSGAIEDYKKTDPALNSSLFPNQKVVGGIDLVGTDFNAASPFDAEHVPKPDSNPLDEAGHGTHVAGTVAGIGDGIHTFSGVAPDATLYAIKVFGKQGSTMDASVIAGFEFAADPNGDLNPSDQLDVVNLSLGGNLGTPQILYSEAVRNLSRSGTVVVAAAGNSGPVDYIVGAPGTSDEALSVAASIDGSAHNWKFPAVRFVSTNNPNWLAKAVEGPASKPISDSGAVSGQLVDIGFADVDLSDDIKAQLSGKVALIQRGKVNFVEKLRRALGAGAIGAVVYNNDPGKPIPMGGDGSIAIPAIMVSQALGQKLLQEMALGPVNIDFQTTETIEEPSLVDTITDFSSKGPRSEDNLLKPEITAPGQRVISAAMGKGNDAAELDGTSMAAPHMAGVMALLKQARPDLTSAQLKALAMNSSKALKNFLLTQQGAGRVQIAEALESPIVIDPPSLSLGRVQLQNARQEFRTLKIKNLKDEAVTLSTQTEAGPGLSLVVPGSVTVPPRGEIEVRVQADLLLLSPDQLVAELNGRVRFTVNGKTVAQVPALALRTQASAARADGQPENLTFNNASPVPGIGLAFNLLAEDAAKPAPAPHESWKARSCDLQSVGYRLLRKPGRGGDVDVIQFGFKLYASMTTWHRCQLSVQIDKDGDGIADQELAGVAAGSVAGIGPAPFFTVLLDAPKARTIRQAYETEIAAGKDAPLTYKDAVIVGGPMAAFPQSSVAMIEIPVAALAAGADDQLHIKVAALAGGNPNVEDDDYLGANSLGEWMTIPKTLEAQPYYGMNEAYIVTDAQSATLTRGPSQGRLVIYYPFNDNSNGDTQSQVIAP